MGYALHSLRENDVPWHRVVNAKGEISLGPERESREIQRMRLEAEGVEFDTRGRISLKQSRWRGET